MSRYAPDMPQPPSQPLPSPQWEQPSYPQQAPPSLPPQPPMRPTKTRKPMGRGMKIGCGAVAALVVLVAIIVIAASAAGGKGSTATPNPQATHPATQNQPTQVPTQVPTALPSPTQAQPSPTPTQAQPSPIPTPTFLTFGDGTYQVGTDIQSGTYRTQSGSQGCYYERLSGFGGTLGEIIANNNTDFPAIVTIKSTDKGFSSQNCGTWTSDLSQITTSNTSFDDGMYIVGTDITPGTYKDIGGDACYYARLSGFSNTIDGIIANDNVSAPTIVTIAASDKGFQSQGCGTWTKI